MHRVRVKIEGLRDPQTAIKIAELGADAIGLVFAASPRQVTPQQARQIVSALPPWVSSVGVFVNADAATINEIVRQTNIGYVQLHGDEGPEMVAQIRGARCIKAFPMRDEGWLHEVKRWLEQVEDRPALSAILLDAYDPAARGGTGKQFNWQWIADARAAGQMDNIGPIILAGGLNPDCVADAIAVANPWAVDVASGVESAPGVKDLDKVRNFIARASAPR